MNPSYDWFLKMIAHLKKLEILGAVIDGKIQVDIVLITLPGSIKFFSFNYSKSRGFCFLVESLKGLQATQGIICYQEHLQMVEKDSSSSTKNN